MTTTATVRPDLPPLPLEEWEATKNTLHLWVQIVGKVKMATSAPRNHWWHVPLYVDVRGLTTRRLHTGGDGSSFEIRFDFLDHRLVVETSGGALESIALVNGLSVAEFDEQLHALLAGLGIDVPILESPYGVPMTTPFPDDREHATYDRDAVTRFWRVRGPALPKADAVTREGYSHELVSFGFWAGDANVREASYYAYVSPEPTGLREQPLRPNEASWGDAATSSPALLSYDVVRSAPEPRATLLSFLESVYEAGADGLGWDRADLASPWGPR